ncbi:putative insulysin [Cyclospora cayetanensis]|uniref:Insulysin n=1 Tax=Cyclospora cayetanensis TaxID=88456 RepID=A0A1D3D7A8_9EIME|nr:putative insulysin [Cyclospora cayetanensis]
MKCVRTSRVHLAELDGSKFSFFCYVLLAEMRIVATIGVWVGLSAVAAFASDILKPEADYRDFRLYQLYNGIRAIAVHHPRSTETGFAVAANAGSLYDPVEIPGLAHFLEHMLFLGTEKYPDPKSYDSFLTENGGSNNAYTDEEKTVFFNKVKDNAFEEALDRFAEFFKAPLFNRQYEEKEVNAIEAEHQKNIPNDDDRVWYTIRMLAKGPMSHFSTGNYETLSTIPKAKGIDVVERLQDFHNKYYCGSNMVAVTISPKSLDEQESLVREKLQGISPGHADWLGMVECPGPMFDTVTPFDSSNTGKFIHLQSFSPEPRLWMAFGLPPTLTSYVSTHSKTAHEGPFQFFPIQKSQPTSVLSYLLEYTGEGSLAQRLRLLGLANGITPVVDRNTVTTLFGIKGKNHLLGFRNHDLLTHFPVDLTQKGAAHRGLVLQEIFSYINFLRDHGVGHDLVASLAQQSQIDFHTTQPGSSLMEEAARLAHNLLTYEPYDVIAGDSLLIDADPRLTNQLLQQMSPSSAIIAFSDPEFTSKIEDFQTDPYYGVQFKVLDIPQHHVVAMTVLTASPNAFRMPPPLLHIPEASELKIIPGLLGLTKPELISEQGGNTGTAVWWQGQGSFALPRIAVQINASIPKTKADLLSRTQGSVALAALAEHLQEETVDFQNCGISHSLGFRGSGFHVAFEGYTRTQLIKLMSHVADLLRDPSIVEQERFERVKDRQMKLLADPTTSLAFEHALEAAAVLTRNDAFSRKDLLNALEQTTYENSFAKLKELKNVHVDAFVMGNVDRDQSLGLVEDFLQQAGFTPISHDQAVQSLAMEQRQTIEATLANPIKGDKNHATLIQLQLGIPSIEDRVNLFVLSQFLNRRIYDSLRTEAQLGYIAGAKESQASSTALLHCFLEGSKSHPDEVVKMIDAELQKATDYLANMVDNELMRWKDSVRAQLTKKEANFSEEFAKSAGEIFLHSNCFEKKELELQYLESDFSLKQLLRTFSKLSDPSRRMVCE